MAEITSGNVTVMVLTDDEASALSGILYEVSGYSTGPWREMLGRIREVTDAFGINTETKG